VRSDTTNSQRGHQCINALESSLKYGEVKRFELTSSSTAAVAESNVEGIVVDESESYLRYRPWILSSTF
jgi:hypothetical protein